MNKNHVLSSDCIIFKDSITDEYACCGVGSAKVGHQVKWDSFMIYSFLSRRKQLNITVIINNCHKCLCSTRKKKKQGKLCLLCSKVYNYKNFNFIKYYFNTLRFST